MHMLKCRRHDSEGGGRGENAPTQSCVKKRKRKKLSLVTTGPPSSGLSASFIISWSSTLNQSQTNPKISWLKEGQRSKSLLSKGRKLICRQDKNGCLRTLWDPESCSQLEKWDDKPKEVGRKKGGQNPRPGQGKRIRSVTRRVINKTVRRLVLFLDQSGCRATGETRANRVVLSGFVLLNATKEGTGGWTGSQRLSTDQQTTLNEHWCCVSPGNGTF